MPPEVTISSPTLSPPSISRCRFCWARCGRMSRNHSRTNIKSRTMKKPLPTRYLLARGHCRRAEPVERRRAVRGKLAPLDRCARSGGQIEQEPYVVLGQKYQAKELLLVHEVAEVGAAEAHTGRAGAVLVEGPPVAREAGVPEVQAALPGQRRA